MSGDVAAEVPARWRATKVGDVVTLQRGFDITKAEQSDGPYPVISSSGQTSTHSDYKVDGPGVVIGRKGSLGGVYFSDGPFWPHDTTLWVKDFHANDPSFIFYWLQTLGLGRYDVGASNPTLNRNHVHLLPASVPGIEAQRKIAAILSSYDDLIDNNDRRIKLLEEMAQRIYHEWFVECRFPGHENVPLVASALGPIPEGWVVDALSNLATVVMGQSPPSSAYNTTGAGLPFHQGVGSYGDVFPIHQMFSTSGSRLADSGDILVSVRAPVGRINLADRRLILGRGLSGVRGNVAPQGFLLHALKHFFREEDVMGGGSIFKSATKRDVEGLLLAWPGNALAQRFAGVVEPVWSAVRVLSAVALTLRATRDLLLPRLISGEVDVTDLDITVLEASA